MAFETSNLPAVSYRIPSNVNLQGLNALTFCCWYRADTRGGSNLGGLFSINDSAGFNVWIESTGLKVRFSDPNVWAITSPVLGVWYHFSLTWNGTTVRSYTDGLETPSPLTRNSTNLLSHHSIGAWKNIASRNWDGLIDDVRFYARNLSINEVRAICKQRGRDTVREGLLYRLKPTNDQPTGGAYTRANDVVSNYDASTKVGAGTSLIEPSVVSRARGAAFL